MRSSVKRLLLMGCGFGVFFAAFFGPALFTGRLIAPGDAFIESLPAYLGPHHLWEPMILLGYPMYADPNQMYWYPLAWLRVIPGSYNFFAVVPFWIAATGMFGLVHALTRSTIGGLVAAVGFALGGFMVSHAGHLMITHPAAWSPFVIWSLEELRHDRRRRWFAMLAASVALCALGGQPQTLAFILAVAACYAVVSSAGALKGRRRYLTTCALGVVLGLGLAAIGLVPEAVLAGQSLRASLSYFEFTSASVPLGELPARLVFPYAAGPPQTFTELTDFAGLGILMLCVITLASRAADRRMWFWAAIALCALALSTGDALGLTALTYHLPLYGLFRVPGRHAFEFTLATAILAGYGAAAMQRGISPVRCAVAIGAIGALIALAVAAVARIGPIDPMHDWRLASSLYAYVAASLTLLAWSIRPKSLALGSAVLAVVVAELVFFGEQAYWRTDSVDAASVRTPPLATVLRRSLGSSGERALWVPGPGGEGLQPNLSLLWSVPVIAGDTPLVIARVAHLVDLADDQTVAYDQSLNLVATRFVLMQSQGPGDLGIFLGNAGEAPAQAVSAGPVRPTRAERIEMVSALGNAVAVRNDAEVAELRVTDVHGQTTIYPILAGRDTAETAYDRPDVRGRVQHRRALVTSSEGIYHRYLATFTITNAEPIDHVGVEWTYGGRAVLTVTRLTLVGPDGTLYPMNQLYGDRSRFRTRAIVDGVAIERNTLAFPRAWTVQRLENATGDGEVFSSIHRGVTPQGERFDPRVSAFVDDVAPRAHLSKGVVSATVFPNGRLRLTTECRGPCFVVSSDAWYPGWHATIDGSPVPLVRSDGALRGLFVPAGEHVVEEYYVPSDLLLGALFTAIALFLTVVAIYRPAAVELPSS